MHRGSWRAPQGSSGERVAVDDIWASSGPHHDIKFAIFLLFLVIPLTTGLLVQRLTHGTDPWHRFSTSSLSYPGQILLWSNTAAWPRGLEPVDGLGPGVLQLISPSVGMVLHVSRLTFW